MKRCLMSKRAPKEHVFKEITRNVESDEDGAICISATTEQNWLKIEM